MVKNQILPNNVKNKELIDAFYNVKKENFIPKEQYDLTYSDAEIKISKDRFMMKTFIVAKMLDRCNFDKDDKILCFHSKLYCQLR